MDGRDEPGHDGVETKEIILDASTHIAIDETSARYDGWRIVAVCFLVATFGWGLGFYGQSVYLAELHRLHGWPASLISSGTTFFYLFGAVLVAFVSEAMRAFGPRNCLLAGIVAMAAAADHDGAGDRRPGSFIWPMRCWRSAGPAPASASSPIRSASGSTKSAAWRSASR